MIGEVQLGLGARDSGQIRAAAEIDVEIFQLAGPVAVEFELDAGARGPAEAVPATVKGAPSGIVPVAPGPNICEFTKFCVAYFDLADREAAGRVVIPS